MSIEKTLLSKNEIIKSIKDNDLVIDVGGAISPCARADYIIDILPYEKMSKEQIWGLSNPRFSKEKWITRDICDKNPWPFADKYFDFSICSHVLEDIRDPIWVCSELIRISKAGLIEIPSRLYETSYRVEGKKLAGASHHRWIIDLENKILRFTFKTSWVHLSWVANKKAPQGENRVLRLLWKDNFKYKENILNSGLDTILYLKRKASSKDVDDFYARLFGYPRLFYRFYKYIKRRFK